MQKVELQHRRYCGNTSPRKIKSPRMSVINSDGNAAMESYTESQDIYTSLFEDKNKYNAIMGALAEIIYREMRKQK